MAAAERSISSAEKPRRRRGGQAASGPRCSPMPRRTTFSPLTRHMQVGPVPSNPDRGWLGWETSTGLARMIWMLDSHCILRRMGGPLIVKGSAAFASQTIPDTTGAQDDRNRWHGQRGAWLRDHRNRRIFRDPGRARPRHQCPRCERDLRILRTDGHHTVDCGSGETECVSGTVADVYGLNLGFLGQVGGSPGAVTVGSPNAGYVDVYLGTVSKGPLLGSGQPAASFRLKDTAAGNSFGVVNFGCGIRGTSQSVSLTGGEVFPTSSWPGQAETGSPIHILSGAAVSAITGNGRCFSSAHGGCSSNRKGSQSVSERLGRLCRCRCHR